MKELNMNIKFGTDGWRAVIDKDFTPENVARMIHAFAVVYPTLPEAGQPIIVGYDRRDRSPETAELITKILTSHGIETFLSSDYCTTPCVSWNVVHKRAAAGIMVTASHNPPHWNGIKFKESYGGAASAEYLEPIEKEIAKNPNSNTNPTANPKLIKSFDPTGEYFDQLREFVNISEINKANFKILHDPMFGSAVGGLSKLIENVTEIHSAHDITFGGLHPEPIRPYVDEAINKMKDGNFDICIVHDGDADRVGLIDENGKYITTHEVYAMLLDHAFETRGWSGNLVKSITTTQMIDRISRKYKVSLKVTPVGFKYISPALKEPGTLAGGEESGGFGFPKHVCERDGLICGLMLLEAMAKRGKKISELVEDVQKKYGPTFYRRIDLKLSPEQMSKAKSELTIFKPKELCGKPIREINTIDGFHFLREDDSWLLMRASGTEPLYRTYAEAASAEEVETLLTEAQRILGI